MPKEEWGVKRVCPTTGKRFYDLNKSPIVSPYTNEVVELDQNKNRMIAADAADMSTLRDKEADVDSEDIVLDEDDDDVEVDLADDILEDDEEDTVPLEDMADISSDDDN
ncbi:MAG: TIGR02300 family protein [Paracoccaceae bacterium]